MDKFEVISLIFGSITVVGVIIFGVLQYSINKRLVEIQDFVAVAIVPNPQSGNIKLLNTGKINLYIHGFEIGDDARLFKKGRLISSATLDSSYYWLPQGSIPREGKFSIKIFLTDEFDKKYITNGGGESTKIDYKKSSIAVWTYKTIKYDWNFDK